MIFWYTENQISQKISRVFKDNGIKCMPIEKFFYDAGLKRRLPNNHIFYGILRGCGNAMRICSWRELNFFYIDNGYFDARYVDDKMLKDLGGTYRVAHNDMIECFEGSYRHSPTKPSTFCVLPPSPYTAYYYNTIPQDWTNQVLVKLSSLGHKAFVRNKNAQHPLDEDLDKCDAVYAFNSMAVMRAIQRGLPVFTTHGIIRNADTITEHFPQFDYEEICAFYKSRQYKIEDLGELKWFRT